MPTAHYRVRQLILMHFRRTFFHDLMTLYSKVNDFWDPEMGRFDMKHYFLTSLTSHGLHDLRKKRYKIFEEMWAWGPHGYATPFSLRLKVAEYQGFHMRYTSLLYQHWFCQKLIKGRRLHCFFFSLSFEYGLEKSVRQLAVFFRYVEIVITKLYLYLN